MSTRRCGAGVRTRPYGPPVRAGGPLHPVDRRPPFGWRPCITTRERERGVRNPTSNRGALGEGRGPPAGSSADNMPPRLNASGSQNRRPSTRPHGMETDPEGPEPDAEECEPTQRGGLSTTVPNVRPKSARGTRSDGSRQSASQDRQRAAGRMHQGVEHSGSGIADTAEPTRTHQDPEMPHTPQWVPGCESPDSQEPSCSTEV